MSDLSGIKKTLSPFYPASLPTRDAKWLSILLPVLLSIFSSQQPSGVELGRARVADPVSLGLPASQGLLPATDQVIDGGNSHPNLPFQTHFQFLANFKSTSGDTLFFEQSSMV